MMKKIILIMSILLTGCVENLSVYKGSDAGTVVIGLGVADGTTVSQCTYIFRRVMTPGSNEKPALGSFFVDRNDFLQKPENDYRGENEEGVVIVQSVPPGDYEIYYFSIRDLKANIDFMPTHNFSIPFSVKPGETTYLGNYQANKLPEIKTMLGMSKPTGVVFMVSDRKIEDVKIAKSKRANIHGEINDFTPVPKNIGSPLFVSH